MGNFAGNYWFSKETYHNISQITGELITILPWDIPPTDRDLAIFTVPPVTTQPFTSY